MPNDEWERIWQINVMQHVYVARHLFPRFAERGSGSLLITASAAGLLTQVGSLPYSVTKHAAVGMAEWMHITYKSQGITVSCLCPQAVRTGMVPSNDEAEDGGPAGTDGVLAPSDVASESIDVMMEGKFLVLPHKEVAKYMTRKAGDYDRWLGGMQRMHESFGKLMLAMPNMSAAKL